MGTAYRLGGGEFDAILLDCDGSNLIPLNSERRSSPSALSQDSTFLPLDEEVLSTLSVGCESDSRWASIEGSLSGSMESCPCPDLSEVKIDLSCLIVFSASLRVTSTMEDLLKTSAN